MESINTQEKPSRGNSEFLDGRCLSEEEKTWLERIKNMARQVLGGRKMLESKDLPPISIEILYAPHETAEDWKGFREALKRADVCVVECSGWSESYLKSLQNLSRGNLFTYLKKKLERKVRGDYDDREKILIEEIYNSKKPVIIIDLPEGHPLVANRPPIEIILQGTFEDMLGQLRAKLKQRAEYQRQREDYMIASLKTKLTELLEEFPELKGKSKIRLLITIGGIHVNLFASIKERITPNVERSYGNKPAGYDSSAKALMRYMLNREVSDELIARTLLGHLTDLQFYARNLTMNNHKAALFENKLVSFFSVSDIKNFFEEFSKVPPEPEKDDSQSARELLFAKLSEKGIELPRTEDELDKFLKYPRPR